MPSFSWLDVLCLLTQDAVTTCVRFVTSQQFWHTICFSVLPRLASNNTAAQLTCLLVAFRLLRAIDQILPFETAIFDKLRTKSLSCGGKLFGTYVFYYHCCWMLSAQRTFNARQAVMLSSSCLRNWIIAVACISIGNCCN